MKRNICSQEMSASLHMYVCNTKPFSSPLIAALRLYGAKKSINIGKTRRNPASALTHPLDALESNDHGQLLAQKK